jgi:hypothetical protein
MEHKLGMWSVECVMFYKADNCNNKRNAEARNVECGTQADHSDNYWSTETGNVECSTVADHSHNKWKNETRNVECGTQADHYTCTVNDVLFANQRFQIWRRREAHHTRVVHL